MHSDDALHRNLLLIFLTYLIICGLSHLCYRYENYKSGVHISYYKWLNKILNECFMPIEKKTDYTKMSIKIVFLVS